LQLAVLAFALFAGREAHAYESCRDVFSGATTTLSELQDHLQKPANRFFDHQIRIFDDTVVLKIGYLVRDGDRSFSRLTLKAVESGAIDEINAGMVHGPKVLPLLLSLKRIAPTDKPLVVRGVLWVRKLKKDLKLQLEGTPRNGTDLNQINQNAIRWSAKELENYENALRTLHLDEVMEAIGDRDKYIEFKFDARTPEQATYKIRKKSEVFIR
jgi:hypothetical protein